MNNRIIKKRILSILLVLCMVLTFVPTTVFAEGGNADAFTVLYGVENTDYTYENNVLTITSATPLTIKNTNPNIATTTDKIVVEKDVSANITLAGVNIDVSGNNDACAFEIAKDSKGSVTITLADNTTNILKSGNNCAGLQKEGTNGSLKIQCKHSGETGHVCTDACGELRASSVVGGGIGSGRALQGNSGAVSGITITGGTVKASSGNGGGIGSGYAYKGDSGAVSDISITGGTVEASGAWGGGIGSGRTLDGNSGAVSDISITGGNVEARSITSTNGGGVGGGIGSGYAYSGNSGTVSGITITGGTVEASSEDGCGIGSGDAYNGNSGIVSNITITGGSVKASSTNTDPIGCTPKNGTTAASQEVYLCQIPNAKGEGVLIDGKVYKPYDHTAIDAADKNLYAYLTGEEHTVQVGTTTYTYTFDRVNKKFSQASSGIVTQGTDYKISAKNGALEYITDYTYQDGILTLNSDKAVTIKMNEGAATTTDTIKAADNVNADITLAGNVVMGDAMTVNGTAMVYLNGHTLTDAKHNKTNAAAMNAKTITFKKDGADYAIEVLTGSNKSYQPEEPMKAGYTLGWYNGESAYSFGSTISEDITLEAKWQSKGYTLKFDTDGGTAMKDAAINYDGKVLEVVTDAVGKEGYRFVGWKCGNTKVTAETLYSDLAADDTVKSVELKAQWKNETDATPKMIDGKGQSVPAGARTELTFRSDAPFGEFIRVEVDGKTIDAKNYTVKEGSTIVTLKADYVAALPAGEHTISIVSKSGTAATTFTVNAQADGNSKSPKTEDNSPAALWFALLIVSGGAVGTSVYRKKRRVDKTK